MSEQRRLVYGEGPDALKPRGCRHRWIIEHPAGPTSVGRCKRCGEEKMFKNHLDYVWGKEHW